MDWVFSTLLFATGCPLQNQRGGPRLALTPHLLPTPSSDPVGLAEWMNEELCYHTTDALWGWIQSGRHSVPASPCSAQLCSAGPVCRDEPGAAPLSSPHPKWIMLFLVYCGLRDPGNKLTFFFHLIVGSSPWWKCLTLWWGDLSVSCKIPLL